MKAFIELPIINNNPKCRLCIPTIENTNGFIKIRWNYQRTSYGCQGQWSYYERLYVKSSFNFDKAMENLTNFIKSEYYL